MSEPDDLLAAFYAGVCAIQEGHIAECEVEHRVIVGETETVITLIARRDVRNYEVAS